MTRSVAVMLAVIITLAVGLAVYQVGPWSYAWMDAITPLVRLAVGIGAVISAIAIRDQRMMYRFAADLADFQRAADQAVARARSAR